eukprot:CAMPEP_0116571608 /NCGR_PEP_ID=MMETSP0397-20121206/17666_1 /TAXON_ID=216820 /ORGANISM="Cyclophora tenuis, Strain ECT3854" /LENGTH=169 /DNA_ID=CAMNT_0004099747 /DNA_START=98 /DNA_END=607 /DNA_ORIENTATION=-
MNNINDWDNEYARLARVASQRRTGMLSTSTADAQALHHGLTRLQQSLETTAFAAQLPAPELARRRRLVQHLQSQLNVSPALQQQDEMIDELAVGVGRLKQQSQMIGEEAKLHLTLLGDMEDQADMAHAGLTQETQRADQIKERQSVFRLQMIIVGLSILLVILLLKGLS